MNLMYTQKHLVKIYDKHTDLKFQIAITSKSCFSNTRPLTCLESDSTICCMCTTVSSWRWALKARNMWRNTIFYE